MEITEKVVMMALSSYATHKDYTVEEWLKVQDEKRNNLELKKKTKIGG